MNTNTAVMTKNFCYWHGDRAEYTGKSEILHSKLAYEIRLVEGHRSGTLLVTYCPPNTTTN